MPLPERWWPKAHGNSNVRILSVAWSQAPECVAYGLLALAPLGSSLSPQAMALALLGTVLANGVAAALGEGRLVSGPRAALSLLTAGLLSALVAYRGPSGPLPVWMVLGLLALSIGAAGLLQILLGALRIGSIVKYAPHPVRSGLMSAVGLLLLIGALPAALGAGFGHGLRDALAHPIPAAMLVAAVAIVVSLTAARRKLPLPAILGLLAGTLVNALVDGLKLPTGPQLGVPMLASPWFAQIPDGRSLIELLSQRALWAPMAGFALTVAALGALDTLLAVSVVDGRLHRVRDANRELRAQGLANLLAGLGGGLPCSPSVQRSLALADAAPPSRRSICIYAMALLALLVLAPQLLAWLPLSAIGGTLLLQGVQSIDPWVWRTPLTLYARAGLAVYDRNQRRVLIENWAVALAVVGIGLLLGLAAAVAVGGALAVLLFVRSNMRQVVRSQLTGLQRQSMKVRPSHAREALRENGASIAVLELQGALFFGTADAVRAGLAQLGPDVHTVVLDLLLVGEIDATGARILLEAADEWQQRDRQLVAAEWGPDDARRRTVDAIARSASLPPLLFVDDVDQALEAAENRLLTGKNIALDRVSDAVALEQTLLGQGLDTGELGLLRGELSTVQLAAGAALFRQGDPADALYLTVCGDLGIRLPGTQRRLVSFAAGTMVGEMGALTKGIRSADAIAETPLTALRLSAESLARLRREQPALAAKLLANIALHLADRLRDLTQSMSTWVSRAGLPATPAITHVSGSVDANADTDAL